MKTPAAPQTSAIAASELSHPLELSQISPSTTYYEYIGVRGADGLLRFKKRKRDGTEEDLEINAGEAEIHVKFGFPNMGAHYSAEVAAGTSHKRDLYEFIGVRGADGLLRFEKRKRDETREVLENKAEEAEIHNLGKTNVDAHCSAEVAGGASHKRDLAYTRSRIRDVQAMLFKMQQPLHTPANGGSHSADPMDRAPARSAEKSSTDASEVVEPPMHQAGIGTSSSGGLSLQITKRKKIDAKVQTDAPDDVGCNCKKMLLSSTSSMCRDLSDSVRKQNGLMGTVISKILTCCSEKILMLNHSAPSSSMESVIVEVSRVLSKYFAASFESVERNMSRLQDENKMLMKEFEAVLFAGDSGGECKCGGQR